MIWLGAVAFVMACLPTVASPATAPTSVPGAVNTFIVQTANAAATQTANALPTSTFTATFTSTPRNTETASPTPTKPFVFILPSVTSFLPTQAVLNNGSSSSEYGCQILNLEPAIGTVFSPRTTFIAKWGVKNIGRNDWFRANMDYMYVRGDRLHKVSSYSIPKGAETGKNVVLPVDMETPKNLGTYTTTWALVVDNFQFCPMTLTIVVQ